MKKVLAWLSVLLWIITGCEQKAENGSSDSSDISIPYTYEGKQEVLVEDRYFLTEQLPSNMAEETVVNSFYYDIAGEYDNLSSLYGANDALRISVKNTEKNYQNGIYIKKFILHSCESLQKDEHNAIYTSLQNDVDKYPLAAYTFVRCTFTMEHSAASLELIPQRANGTYTQTFLCGRASQDTAWKIYEVYWY